MSRKLRNFLVYTYTLRDDYRPSKIRKEYPIQIDDQDPNDNIAQFCNVFVTVGDRNTFILELCGNFPVMRKLIDLAEIYEGGFIAEKKKVIFHLNFDRIEVIRDICEILKDSATMGESVENPEWIHMSARTVSTLNRFSRTIKEYLNETRGGF